MTSELTVALLAQAIGFAFAAGGLLLLVLTLLPPTRSVARQLWPVLASEAAILMVGVLPWLMPQSVLFCALLIASARIGYESGTIHGPRTGRDFSISHALLLTAVSALAWFAPSKAFLWILIVTTLVALAMAARFNDGSLTGSLARFTLFPMLPLAAFSHAAADPALAPLLVLAFFLVEMFDSFSLLGGKLYGRTPLVPRLSPRKTWEGLATGIGAVVIALVSLVAWLDVPLVPMAITGIVVVAAAIVGDFLGSLAKRRAGVKDYPAVMTVQGGLLDITDAWIVAGPCLAGAAVALGWL